jgi:branched-chain amino acid transport system substrate-binding protein
MPLISKLSLEGKMRMTIYVFLFATISMTAALSRHAEAQIAPVKIGVLTDMNGVYSDPSGKGSVEAVNMAVEDYKKKFPDSRVEVIFADHQNKAATAASLARKWYDDEGVDMIVDLTNSAVAIAVQDISKEKKKINLITGATMTTVVTNQNCSPWGLHWTIDAYNQAAGTAHYLVTQGGKTWFFITVDFAFGHDTEAKAAALVKAAGGQVLGRALHPINGTDFSSYLLQAKASGAQIVGLATAGTDMSNLLKQAAEFRMLTSKQKFAGLVVFIHPIRSLGLETAQGLILTTPFYWDLNEETRAWSARFYKRHGTMPSMVHAGGYSATMHYLNAIRAAGTKDTEAVMAKMRETPVNDFFAKNGRIRGDGVLVRDMHLAIVKSPGESKKPWDYYKIVQTLPKEKLFQPLAENSCPLVKK